MNPALFQNSPNYELPPLQMGNHVNNATFPTTTAMRPNIAQNTLRSDQIFVAIPLQQLLDARRRRRNNRYLGAMSSTEVRNNGYYNNTTVDRTQASIRAALSQFHSALQTDLSIQASTQPLQHCNPMIPQIIAPQHTSIQHSYPNMRPMIPTLNTQPLPMISRQQSLISESTPVMPLSAPINTSLTDFCVGQTLPPLEAPTEIIDDIPVSHISTVSTVSSISNGDNNDDKSDVSPITPPTEKYRQVYTDNHINDCFSPNLPFKCNICGAKFARKCNLNDHQRIHDGFKPFNCPHPGCGARFRRQHTVTSHIKTVHLKIKAFACSKCDKKYTAKHNLEYHIIEHHS